MCNLSDRIEERGMKIGEELGMKICKALYEKCYEIACRETTYELVSDGVISIKIASEYLNQTTPQVLDGMHKAGFSIPQ